MMIKEEIDMNIVLYSTNCPKCIVLEKKLTQKGIEFEVINDVKAIRKLGYLTAPLLEVNGNVMDFTKANEWVNTQ